MPKLSLVCPVCNRSYDANPNRLKHGKQTTCSRECSYTLRGIAKTQFLYNLCERCGVQVKTTQYRLDKGQDKFCSRKCFHPPALFRCLNCGCEFKRPPSAKSLYCSTACCYSSEKRSQQIKDRVLAQWQDPTRRQKLLEGIKKRSLDPAWLQSKHFQRGDLHPRYKGIQRQRKERYEYKLWRKTVFVRDCYTCQSCNARGVYLNAHHVKPWAKYPELRFELSNGVALCEPCHDAVHEVTKKPKTYKCEICGVKKTDGRSKRCLSCASRFGASKN